MLSHEPAVHPAQLLAGALALDLPLLKRAADAVLARVEGLGEDPGAAPADAGPTRWLVLAFVTVGTFEFARRRFRPQDATRAADRDGTTEPTTWDL